MTTYVYNKPWDREKSFEAARNILIISSYNKLKTMKAALVV